MSKASEEDLRVAAQTVTDWRHNYYAISERLKETPIAGSDLAESIATALSKARAEGEAVGIGRAAEVAASAENEWIEHSRNVARADDLVGGLAQSTYNNYAELAGKIKKGIRTLSPDPNFLSRREDVVRAETWKEAIAVVQSVVDSGKFGHHALAALKDAALEAGEQK